MAAMAGKAPTVPTKVNPAAVNSKIIHETYGVCSPADALRRSSSRSVLSRRPTDSWTSITKMPKDIAEYAIDQAVWSDLKKDDIKRHSTDEKLDPFQRAAICLKSTESLERVFVAEKFAMFIHENADRAFKELVPGFIQELKRLRLNFHTSAAAAIVGACRELYPKNVAQAKTLFNLIFQYIDADDQAISQAWTNSMIDLMGFLSPNEIEQEFAPVLTGKAKDKSQINGRKAACILLKKMLSKVNPDFGSKQLIPLVGILCNDPEASVKGTICLQLPLICQYFKSKESILQYLNVLAKDVDTYVRTSVIFTIRKVFVMPELKSLYLEILQIMKKIVKEAYSTNNLQLLQEFSLDMGEIAITLADAEGLDGENKLWFLDAYLQMCRYGLTATERPSGVDLPAGFANFLATLNVSGRKPFAASLISSGGIPRLPKSVNGTGTGQAYTCRVNAAKGFASFVKFAKPLVDFKNGLHPLIADLIHDPNPLVRAAMAGNIYPIMQLLEPHGQALFGEFVTALSDDDLLVIEAIVPCISDVLKVLVGGRVISPEVMTQALVEVGGALIFCEERLQGTVNWRMHAKLLEQLSILPYCVPGDYIYANIVPNLFYRLLHLRQMPCRLAAADTIIAFLRHCRRVNQREEIRHKIKETFANGKSFHDRMLYLFMSKMIMDNFSRKYFRDYFFEQTLHMADDPVANVRMKLCGMVPNMKGTLKNAEDDRLFKKLDEVVNRIRSSETDRDVQNALREAIEDMQRMAEKAEKAARSKDKRKGGRTREDAEDEKKEKEEAYIASLEPAVAPVALKNKNKPKEPVKPAPARRVSVKPPLPPKVPESPLQPPAAAPIPVKKELEAPKPKVIQQRTNRKDFGNGTKIVEKTAKDQQEAKENPFLAEAQTLRRKALVPIQVTNPLLNLQPKPSRAPPPAPPRK